MGRADGADGSSDGTLEARLVGDISGRFVVPAYQRGYRWGATEVRQLLEDVWGNGDKPYCLQPVVVTRRRDDGWELVDGQQRLTTIYLILRYFAKEGLQKGDPPYSLVYESRERSAEYLATLSADDRWKCIDFAHMYTAYEQIQSWFEERSDGKALKLQQISNKFLGYLLERVNVIWYEAPDSVDAVDLFTRLNLGRIPLTNAELVKASLLSESRKVALHGRAVEIAAQWDAIERELQVPDFWAFISNDEPESHPTRIELLFELLAHREGASAAQTYDVFERLRPRIEATPLDFWNDVLDLHALLREWQEDRDVYHKIGYLVATGVPLGELVRSAIGTTKTAFLQSLDRRIRDSLGLRRSELEDLRYETGRGCADVLFLMNVESVRRLRDTTERYPFRLHKWRRGGDVWSLEHIHAQHAEGLKTVAQWERWLKDHRAALATLPNVDDSERATLLGRIDGALAALDRRTFDDLWPDVARAFAESADEHAAALSDLHSIANLALLSCGDNSALGNAAFEVKRRVILDLDRAGSYIPLATRRVFLKYYTSASDQHLQFWGTTDRKAYFDAIVDAVEPYLTPESA